MTAFEEQVLELVSRKNSLEKELSEARAVATKASLELEGTKVNGRRAGERLKALQEAYDFLHTEALIVDFDEYSKIKTTLNDNKNIVGRYEALGNEARIKGQTAGDRIKAILEELTAIDKELSSHGKVLAFPRHPKVPAAGEAHPDVDA